MIDAEPLEKIIALTLQSSYVRNNTKAVSLLIASDAEHGKTSSIVEVAGKLIKEKRVFYSNNVTAKFIEKTLLKDIEEGRIKHIIIPDILNAIERGKTTRKLFVNFMKSLVEEGIIHIADAYGFFTARDSPVRCGLITAITKDNLNANRAETYFEWKNIGFLSRLVIFSFSYPIEKIIKIIDGLMEVSPKSEPKYKIRMKEVEVEDAKDYSAFKIFAMTNSKPFGGVGIRLTQNLVALARSNAVLEGRAKVEKRDIDEVMRLTKWINFSYNPM